MLKMRKCFISPGLVSEISLEMCYVAQNCSQKEVRKPVPVGNACLWSSITVSRQQGFYLHKIYPCLLFYIYFRTFS